MNKRSPQILSLGLCLILVYGPFLSIMARGKKANASALPVTPSDYKSERSNAKAANQETALKEPTLIEGQSATLLPTGDWLLLGGKDQTGTLSTAIIKNTLTGLSTPLANKLLQPRAGHSSTMLPNGKILIFGGINKDGHLVNEIEIFDPQSQSFGYIKNPGLSQRAYHTGTLLMDGSVLFIGGMIDNQVSNTAELWDTKTNTVLSIQAALQTARYHHSATLLSNGNVVLWGGKNAVGNQIKDGEIYYTAVQSFGWMAENAEYLESSNGLYLAGSVPQMGAVDVAINSYLTLQFSKPIRPESISGNVKLAGDRGDILVNTSIAEGGRLLFINPQSTLEEGANYTISVINAKSRDGQDFSPITLSFTTFSSVKKNASHDHADHQHISSNTENNIGTYHPLVKEEWMPESGVIKNSWKTNRPKSKHEDLLPLQAAAGETALSGQVLNLNGEPVKGVTMFMGDKQVQTDDTGRFLISSLQSGRHGLVIGGHTVKTNGAPYGTFEVLLDIKPGRTNVLPFKIWLPLIDVGNATQLPERTTQLVVAKTPRIPGFEAHIPAGVVLRHPSGDLLKSLSITPLPVDRPVFPLPNRATDGALVSLQLHGAKTEDAQGRIGKGLTLVFPNYGGQPAGSRVELWNYDPKVKGWYIYGYGTVSSDGSKVIPDAGREVQGAFCIFFLKSGPSTYPNPGDSLAKGADPIDLSTGLFLYEKTDLTIMDTIPITLTRTYRSNDRTVRPFGYGSTHPYDIFLMIDNTSSSSNLILPDGGRIYYTRTSAGTGQENAIMEHTSTPTMFYKSTLSWNDSRTPKGWDLKLQNGTTLQFDDQSGHEMRALCAIVDRYGNQLTVVRDTNYLIQQVRSPNGRWVSFTWDGFMRITQLRDNIGRTVNYTYDGGQRLWKVTDTVGGITEYTYDGSTGNLFTIKDPKGIIYLKNEYDANMRVVKQTQADGSFYQVSYTTDSFNNVTQADLTLFSPTGTALNTRRVAFNSKGYTVSNTEALGKPEEQTTLIERQSGSNLVLSVTDPLNRKTAYAYDSMGRVTDVTWLAGTPQSATTHYTYEPTYNQVASVTDPLQHTTTFEYDSSGNLTKVKDPLNHESTFTYNAAGQVLTATDALQHQTQFTYIGGDLISITDPLGRTVNRWVDDAGRVVRLTNTLGLSISYEYDAANLLKKIIDPQQGQTSFTYDPNGNLLSVTDPRENVTTYTYDNMDRLASRKDPLQGTTSIETYDYDASGNLSKYTDRRGKVTTYQYDALNRRTFTGFGTTTGPIYESTIGYTYDAVNRLIKTIDSISGTITRNYNDANRTFTETTTNGTITYSFDEAGRLISKNISGQANIGYSYDDANRLTSIAQGTNNVSFGYDNINRLTTMTLPNGLVSNYNYDSASQLTEISYKSGLNTLGNLTYGYDQLGRRTKVGGSLARTLLPQPLNTATYNNANQLTQREGASLSYDANGNLTNDGINTYSWNARNQLSAISGNVTASFKYDAFGRRIEKTINGATTGYFYDGNNAVQEIQGGSATANMLTGGIDQTFSRNDANGMKTPITDALGSVVGLSDSNGTVSTHYTYDPFGNTTSSGQASSNSSKYTGREDDGTELYYYRARYYSPSLQRFISEDPIGFAGGDVNLYAYVWNNPVNFVDPSGLDGKGKGNVPDLSKIPDAPVGDPFGPTIDIRPDAPVIPTVDPPPALTHKENKCEPCKTAVPRMPDMVSLSGAVPIPNPYTLLFAGIGAQVTLARNGGLYLSIGPAFGWPGAAGGALTGGWLNQKCKPTSKQLDDFNTGLGFSAGGAYGVYVGESWSPGNGTATNIGGGLKGAGISGGWGFKLASAPLSW
jgi:RHS repeat-associated protein